MADLLNTSLRDLFAPDPEHRHLLHQVVESVQLDQGISYMDALERVHEASESAHNDRKPTLRGALEWIQADSDAIAENLVLLDQRDTAVGRAYSKPAANVAKIKRDPFGRVLLGQDYAKQPRSLDADGRIMDPLEFEKRLRRARKLDARYAGDSGRAEFKRDDEAHLTGGVDLVKTLELAQEDQAASANAGELARQFDQSIAANAEKARELKLLDGQLDELQGQREKLQPQAAAAAEGLRMLDQGRTASKPKKKKLTELEQRQRKLEKRARKRMRRLGVDYVVALEAEVRGEPMPKAPGKAPSSPGGVDPGSHELHGRIARYMAANELPDKDYPKVLDQVVRGQVRL